MEETAEVGRMFHIETLFHIETCIRFNMKNRGDTVDKLIISAYYNLNIIRNLYIRAFLNIGTGIAIILVQSFTIKGGKT